MRLMTIPEGAPLLYRPQGEWLAHGPFAQWLVHALEPRQIVELGTRDGHSYFCLCQAAAEAGGIARCFAAAIVPDDPAAGDRERAALRALQDDNARYESFSTLLPETATAAAAHFGDGSVDLLHIANQASGDAVKRVFECWMPKLSDRAVVLFEGTGDRGEGADLRRYWEDLAAQRPSAEFPQGRGLGVLFWGATIAPGLRPLATPPAPTPAKGTAQDRAQLRAERDAAALARRELARQSQALDKLSFELERARLDVAQLQHLLSAARRNPLRQFGRNIVFGTLRALLKAEPHLPRRMADRFARSASKRDPCRNDLRTHPEIAGDAPSYEAVLQGWEQARRALAPELKKLADRLRNGPLISIVVPVSAPRPDLLAELIESVLAQSYANWEICFADDGSADPAARRVLIEYAAKDARIRQVFGSRTGDPSGATNSAIGIARGAWLAFVDDDDRLDPDALLLVAQLAEADPEARIIYTDEDKIGRDGARCEPQFKPDWNRELFYGLNYVSHLGVYDAALVRQAGGLRPGYDGAQGYDLLLRCLERIGEHQIRHIPKVLCSARATPEGAAASARPVAAEAGRRALAEHLQRRLGYGVPVEPGLVPLSYRVRWPAAEAALVSIVIPTRDALSVLRVAVESILRKTSYRHFELIIVDNGSVAPQTAAWLAEIQASDARVRVLQDARPFNYSALNNGAVAASRGDIVALMNNDIEVIDPDWLTEMVALAQRPEVGCVGAKLLYPDGRIQHAGVVIGIGGVAAHGHALFPGEDPGYCNRLLLRQEYSAVTAACLVLRRAVFDAVGGLNETDLSVAFNDVDFCLRVREAGYRNLWTPFARLYHHESISRGEEDTPEKRARFLREVKFMQDRWKTTSTPDPAYNPNLTLDRGDFSYGPPQWPLTA